MEYLFPFLLCSEPRELVFPQWKCNCATLKRSPKPAPSSIMSDLISTFTVYHGAIYNINISFIYIFIYVENIIDLHMYYTIIYKVDLTVILK